MDVTRTCTTDDTVAIIERLVTERGAPEHLRMDIHSQCRLDRPAVVQLAA
jgi:hypothetical protein